MRRVAMRPVTAPDRRSEPGFREWHQPAWGECACCGARGQLIRHHVVTENHLRALGADPWDLRNALLLGVHCRCHSAHHSAASRLAASCIPAPALEYMIEVLGAEVGDRYLERYYAPR